MRDGQLTLFGRPVWADAATPLVGDGLLVGDIWVDLFASLTKRCTSISPVTFISIEAGSGTITLADIASQADQTILGNNTGSPASPLALTDAQVKTMLNLSGTNTGDQTITLTSDITGSGTGSFAATLATVNSNVGSYTNASITVNGKGLITAASNGSGGSGTVTSVSGTANQIDVATGTTTPVISIDSGYVGQSSITTLGTITTGVWNGTGFTVPYGGTGVASTTAYGILAGGTTTTAALQNVGNGTTGYSLISQGSSALPQYTLIPGRNLLVNGDFLINQLIFSSGTSITTVQHTYDCWDCAVDAGGSGIANLFSFSTNNSIQGVQVTHPSGAPAGKSIRLCQSLTINACRRAANNLFTLSFNALRGSSYSATSNLLTVTLYSGTGATDKSGINGAFTGSATPISTTVTLNTSMTSYSITSSALGATVSQLCVEFSYVPTNSGGANDNFRIQDIQLEQGPYATPFDRKSFSASLFECQFFYQKSFPYSTAPAQAAGTTGCVGYTSQISSTTDGFSVYVPFPVTMRAAPTMTYYNPTSSNGTWRNITNTSDSGTAATSGSIAVGTSGVVISNPQVAGDGAGKVIGLHYQADARLT